MIFSRYSGFLHQENWPPQCNWNIVESGVKYHQTKQQIVDPLLFLLFINDIVTDIKASIKLFADDTSLYVTVDAPQNAADIINRDLEKINQWYIFSKVNLFSIKRTFLNMFNRV
jgi:hypothetical protein